jgi:hypothetical protein
MSDLDLLKQDKVDHIVSTTKSVVGSIPMIGPLLSEVVGSIVPNQRIDRITRFLDILEQRLDNVESEIIDVKLKDVECIDLIEEGFLQASRALSDERRVYIANIVANGISDAAIDYYEAKFVMKIVQELNDQEVIWLRSYLCITLGGDEEFREKHKNILELTHVYIGSDDRTKEKGALQESYKLHLHRLNLITPSYSIDYDTGMPEFDDISGQQKVSYWYLTALGRLALKLIDLYDKSVDTNG